MKKVLIVLCSFLFISSIKAEELSFADKAKSAILMEASTGEIIFEKNSHERLEPASMTKMMSMLLIVESIDKGIINWDDIVTVSENASSMGGSQILLETGEKMSVSDLFKGIAVASGNDAVVAMAEKIAGSEEAFVNMMNKRAKELGLKDTNFKNPHGLDIANHYSSAYDMSIIAKELVKHEEIFKYTSIYEDYLRQNTDRQLWLVNTNKLVRFYDGVDGLKTGYTTDAGYCLTATAKKNGMRIIAVVMGEPDSKIRNAEVTEMLDYAFAQYELEKVLSTDSVLGKQKVEKGSPEFATLIPTTNINLLNKKTEEKKNVTYELHIDKIKAPVKAGDIVGNVEIKDGDKIISKIDVTIKEDIKKNNFISLIYKNLIEMINGDFN